MDGAGIDEGLMSAVGTVSAPPGGVLHRVTRNTLWLYAAELLPRVSSLLLIPIWSVRVAPAEYARWILTLTSAELLLEVGGVGVGSFLTKVVYRYRDDRAKRYFWMGAMVMLAVTAGEAIVVAAASPWLSRLVIGGDVRGDLFAFLALYLVLAQVANLAILYAGTRVQYANYFFLIMLRGAANIGFLLVFLLGYHQGFYSWVWAAVATEALLFPVAAFQLRHLWRPYLHRRMLRFALRLGTPFFATGLMSWGYSRVGRYVLSSAGLGTGLGLYGVAEKFAQNYGAMVRPTKIVALRVMGHTLEDDAGSPYYVEFFHLFACAGLAAAFLLSLFLGDVAAWFVAPAYRGAMVALAPLIFSLYLVETCSLYESLLFRYFKVWFYFFRALMGFLVVVGLTIVLVPRFGFFGAAAATLVGAMAMVIVAHQYTMRVSRRPLRFGEKMVFMAVGLGLVVLAERLAVPLGAKAALAVAVLWPYLGFYWRRRQALFPVLLSAQRMSRTGMDILPPSRATPEWN